MCLSLFLDMSTVTTMVLTTESAAWSKQTKHKQNMNHVFVLLLRGKSLFFVLESAEQSLAVNLVVMVVIFVMI